MMGSCSNGHSIPRSPRATIRPSDSLTMASRFEIADWSSILAIIFASEWAADRYCLSMVTSLASRTKERA